MGANDTKITADDRARMAAARDLALASDPPVWLRNVPASWGQRECEAATEAVREALAAARDGREPRLTDDHRAALAAVEAVDVRIGNPQSLNRTAL